MNRLRKSVWLVCVCLVGLVAVSASAEQLLSNDEILAQLNQIDIDWKQADGVSIYCAFQSESDTWKWEDYGMISLFQELTGINVDYTMFEEAQLREKTTTDIMTGTGIFDAYMFDPMYMRGYDRADGLQDLNVFLDDPALTDKVGMDWPADFPADFVAMGSLDDRILGLPMHMSGQILYYNKKIFEENGLDPNHPPATMEEMAEFAAACHHPEDGQYGIALRGLRGAGLNVFAWSSFFKAFGGEWFDADWNPMLDSPEAIASVEYYANLVRDYGPPGVANWEWSKILNALQQGTIAMTIDAPPFAGTIEDESKSLTAGEWGYAPNPAGAAGRVMTPYSWFLGISPYATTEKQQAAWLFISFVTSKPVQLALGTMECPSRKSVILDDALNAELPWMAEWQAALVDNSQYADPDARPRLAEWAEIGDAMGVELESVIAGSKDAATACASANQQIQRIMEEAGY